MTPRPELSPAAVVKLILGSLRQPDDLCPCSRATLLYAYASPRLRSHVGRIEDLERLLRNELYRPLLEHRSATTGPLRRLGHAARQEVTVVGADGATARYLFALARQRSGAHENCWLLTGISRELPL